MATENRTPEEIASALPEALRAAGWPARAYTAREMRVLVSMLRRAFPSPRIQGEKTK